MVIKVSPSTGSQVESASEIESGLSGSVPNIPKSALQLETGGLSPESRAALTNHATLEKTHAAPLYIAEHCPEAVETIIPGSVKKAA